MDAKSKEERKQEQQMHDKAAAAVLELGNGLAEAEKERRKLRWYEGIKANLNRMMTAVGSSYSRAGASSRGRLRREAAVQIGSSQH